MVTPRTGGRPGRPRKPTQLAVLHGDHKKNPGRVNRNEPKPPPADGAAPDWLSPAAARVWDEVAPSMVAMGVLTVWDLPLFAELCEALALARHAHQRAVLEQTGQLAVASGAASPTTQWAKIVGLVAAIGGRFGMTPADRAQLATRDPGQHDPTEDLLSG